MRVNPKTLYTNLEGLNFDQAKLASAMEVLETYKPHILGRRRRLIEDCVRDLRLNNDHIHIIEQAMRKCIEVSFPLFFWGGEDFYLGAVQK